MFEVVCTNLGSSKQKTHFFIRAATKSGNIREFYFQSGKILGKGEIFQKIRENRGTFRFLIFFIPEQSLSPYSATYPVECDCCQIVPFSISFCCIQSF